jgi:hypothetical protein
MDSVPSGTNSSEAQHRHGENIFQATGRTLQSRIIAGFVVTAALLAGTVKISAAQQAVQPAFHVLHVFDKQGDGQVRGKVSSSTSYPGNRKGLTVSLRTSAQIPAANS